MFIAALKYMIVTYQEFMEQSKSLANQIEELRNIKNSLRFLSGMEHPIHELNKCIQDLENNRYILLQMVQVLERAITTYSNCEQRIMNNYEQSAYIYKKVSVGFTSLDSLGSVLWDINFIT